MEPRNQPYIKRFDAKNELINPINGAYIHEYPNRKKRRQLKQKNRFVGNHKGHNLVVINNGPYSEKLRKVVQVIKHKLFGTKKIQHYIPC